MPRMNSTIVQDNAKVRSTSGSSKKYNPSKSNANNEEDIFCDIENCIAILLNETKKTAQELSSWLQEMDNDHCVFKNDLNRENEHSHNFYSKACEKCYFKSTFL